MALERTLKSYHRLVLSLPLTPFEAHYITDTLQFRKFKLHAFKNALSHIWLKLLWYLVLNLKIQKFYKPINRQKGSPVLNSSGARELSCKKEQLLSCKKEQLTASAYDARFCRIVYRAILNDTCYSKLYSKNVCIFSMEKFPKKGKRHLLHIVGVCVFVVGFFSAYMGVCVKCYKHTMRVHASAVNIFRMGVVGGIDT